eukprot:GHVU01053486.1.p2 GENE.GHVU01053486.1~~GHVU01053486.1.p2  ORF type:complete len:324 (-),score=75.71 GHVU01053486.1:81-1052(-)
MSLEPLVDRIEKVLSLEDSTQVGISRIYQTRHALLEAFEADEEEEEQEVDEAEPPRPVGGPSSSAVEGEEEEGAAGKLLQARTRRTLLHAFISPPLYKTEDGTRFLRFVLSELSPSLSADAVQCVKHLLPTTRAGAPILKAFGKVLFHAYKYAEGSIKAVLEKSVGTFVDAAASLEPRFAAKCREVLNEFSHSREAATAGLFKTFHEPIIWEYLNMPNHKCRANAATLLSLSFPLSDPESCEGGPEEYLEDMERQFNAFNRCLTDRHPDVRVVAIRGVCRNLASHWELFPQDKLTTLLETLVTKTACDASSPAVRAATLEGLE